jgi:inorganic pyrophosphatase
MSHPITEGVFVYVTVVVDRFFIHLRGGSEKSDDKIIAVQATDPSVKHIHDLADLPPYTLQALQRFFEDYKALEHKHVRIERFLGQEEGRQALLKGLRLYEQQFGPEYSGR